FRYSTSVKLPFPYDWDTYVADLGYTWAIFARCERRRCRSVFYVWKSVQIYRFYCLCCFLRMGIRGLSSYIETLDVWEKIELKDTKVVIDGSCLMFNLYYNSRLDFRNGGEYYEFAQVVTSFFQALSSNNVEAYVVLDGAIDPSGRKVDTIESRMQDSIDNAGKPDGRVRPKMSALVLRQAMRDIGVKFVRIDWYV
ncbi:predicted protein, partial [Nematostella vectensis]